MRIREKSTKILMIGRCRSNLWYGRFIIDIVRPKPLEISKSDVWVE